ncbi:MAG: hypothetical protein JXR89_10060, partial [Deltaproteobacteria bacterium]|nr:hypothetical protein [Deltaproteobacteria bacterium]
AEPHTIFGTTDMPVSLQLSFLPADTTYHYRVVAENGVGITQGADLTFKTNFQHYTPAVSTAALNSITTTSASGGGTVTDEGQSPTTARGLCWSLTEAPTVNDNFTSDGSGAGAFSSEITGLAPSTTYYVRAYATNSYGTAYGEQESFTTDVSSETIPTLDEWGRILLLVIITLIGITTVGRRLEN